MLVLRSATHTNRHAGRGNIYNTISVNSNKHFVLNNSEEGKLLSQGANSGSKIKKFKKNLFFF